MKWAVPAASRGGGRHSGKVVLMLSAFHTFPFLQNTEWGQLGATGDRNLGDLGGRVSRLSPGTARHSTGVAVPGDRTCPALGALQPTRRGVSSSRRTGGAGKGRGAAPPRVLTQPESLPEQQGSAAPPHEGQLAFAAPGRAARGEPAAAAGAGLMRGAGGDACLCRREAQAPTHRARASQAPRWPQMICHPGGCLEAPSSPERCGDTLPLPCQPPKPLPSARGAKAPCRQTQDRQLQPQRAVTAVPSLCHHVRLGFFHDNKPEAWGAEFTCCD